MPSVPGEIIPEEVTLVPGVIVVAVVVMVASGLMAAAVPEVMVLVAVATVEAAGC